MAQIFISYSRSDRLFLDIFLPLIRKVYGNNILWYDDDIHGGADWWSIILNEIGDCELFIYLISNESLESPYCHAELREALRLNKQVLPVLVRRLKPPYPGNIPDDLEPALKKTQYVDLTDMKDTTGIANLYAAINRLSKQTPSLAPPTTQPTPQPLVSDKKKPSWWEKLTEGQGVVIAAIIGLIGVLAVAIIGLSGRDNAPQEVAVASTEAVITTTTVPDEQPQIVFLRAIQNGGNTINTVYIATKNESGDWITRRLVNDEFNYLYPEPSPDGSQIALVSDRLGNWGQIWLVDTDGTGEPTQLTENRIYAGRGLTWSPDGQQIAFPKPLNNTNQLYIISFDRPDEFGEPVTTSEFGIQNPAWSPDGRYIAYALYASRRSNNDENSKDNLDIWIYDLKTGENQPVLYETNEDTWAPTWSPNGDFLIYTLDFHDDDVPCDLFRVSITINAEDQIIAGRPTPLTENRSCDWDPSISPDGAQVAYRNTSSDTIRIQNTSEIEASGNYEEIDDEKPENWLHDGWPRWIPAVQVSD